MNGRVVYSMDIPRCISAFKDLAQRMGIVMRYTAEGPSGLCTIKGERIFFLNRMQKPEDQLHALIRDFKTIDDIDSFFILPVIRGLMGRENDTDTKSNTKDA
jgi:hypothetical protein